MPRSQVPHRTTDNNPEVHVEPEVTLGHKATIGKKSKVRDIITPLPQVTIHCLGYNSMVLTPK